MSVPGIGPIISTGLVAAIGTGEPFNADVTSVPCSASFPGNTARVAGQSWAASQSAAANTFALSLSRLRRSF